MTKINMMNLLFSLAILFSACVNKSELPKTQIDNAQSDNISITDNHDLQIKDMVDNSIESDNESITNQQATIKKVTENPKVNLESEQEKTLVIKESNEQVMLSNKSTEINNEPEAKFKAELDETKVDVKPTELKEEIVKEAGLNPKSQQTEPLDEQMAFSHDSFDVLLKKHVSDAGKVSYKGFKSEEAKLDTYLKLLADNHPDGWSRDKELAYWINAYNAFTIKLILNNYPTSSIMNIDGGKPWDTKWIKLGSKTYSLNNIEHDIIRPKFKDARIHFAVNCAAKSCPPVYNQAFTAAGLNTQLDKVTKKFLNNPNSNTITSNGIKISKIMEWYAVDFGDLITFLNKYTSTKIDPSAKIEYHEYDWSLNE